MRLMSVVTWVMAVLMPSIVFAEKPQSVGLVLSGGGAKGIAHIGVIRALEDNDIPIDYITGTSMGAIVGGLYASGYTTEEMMALIGSREFAYWSTGQIDPKLTYYFDRKEATPALMTLNVGDRDSTKSSGAGSSILPKSIISPLPMNFGVLELFSPYTAQCGGDFDKLFVPFRCIVSDVTHKRKVVCSSGSLGDAIRASMNFPIVFHPIERDGALLYDGGIYENYPVATMRKDFAPTIMIGVDVSAADKPSSNDIIDQLEDLIIQHSSHAMPADEGIGLRIKLDKYGLMDFDQARAIYKIGYDYAMGMMDSIKERVYVRISPEARELRRSVFKSQTPALNFDSVRVTGGSEAQNEFMTSMFRQSGKSDTLGIDDVRKAYYRVITPGKLQNLEPSAEYNDSTGLFSLDLKATVKDNYEVGLGGYISTSTSSMLYFSAAYRTFSYRSLNTGVKAWVGQSYLAGELNSRISVAAGHPSSIGIQIVGSREKFYEDDRLFMRDDQPAFVRSSEVFGRIEYGAALGRRGKLSVGVGAGHLLDNYYTDIRSEVNVGRRDRSMQNLLQVYGELVSSTLDMPIYPTAGSYYKAKVMGVTGRHVYTSAMDGVAAEHRNRSFGQVELQSRNFWSASRHFSFGLESDVLLSTRSLLSTYYASIVAAPAFYSTPSWRAVFDPDLRAYNFAALTAVPVLKMNDIMQVRGTVSAFMPIRRIEERADGGACYGSWLTRPYMSGEVAAVATLPFASVSAYARYTDTAAGRWNFGISLGVFILAPRFLR